MSRCKSCHARITWALTERGQRMPLDAKPDPAGSIVLRARGDDPPLAIVGVPDDVFPEEPRYLSHFATCPDGKQWRGKRRR